MSEEAPRRLHIAGWETRFVAWLIDVVVVGAVVNVFWGTLSPLWFLRSVGVVDVGQFGGVNGLGLWLYWTLLEGYSGQSVGKLVVDVRVTTREGDPIDYGAAAVESFGKAFLLPIDVLVGVLAYEGRKLRLFNRLSETIVVETESASVEPPEGVEYVMPDQRD